MAPFLKFQTWGVPQKIDIHTTSTVVLPCGFTCDSLLQVKVFIVSIEYVLLYLNKTL